MKKIKKIGSKIVGIGKLILGLLIVGLLKIRDFFVRVINGVQNKLQKLREYIQNYKEKREKIKLIEAGSMILETEENNIIKEVFEDKMAQLESDDDIAYQKKLDELKSNIEDKTKQEEMLPENVRVSSPRQSKSKFDLIREQQEKKEPEIKVAVKESQNQILQAVENEEKRIQIENQKKQEELLEKQKVERQRKEAEKKARQEKIDNHEEIDFHNQENLTEEMIRKQVEIDDLVRLAEQEKEEEILKAQQMKRKERYEKRRERLEKFHDMIDSFKNIKEGYSMKNAIKIEEKLRRESQKNENRVRIAKEREEKRAFRELERQKYKQELRIQEELQEDNLYPRPRM